MVFGVVSGSRISSSIVEAASERGSTRFSGLKSKVSRGISARHPSASSAPAASTQRRCFSRKRSAGASSVQPTSRGSARTGSTASRAGSSVRLSVTAISMPTPAISPSSETPR